ETLKPSQNLYAQLLLLQVGNRGRQGGTVNSSLAPNAGSSAGAISRTDSALPSNDSRTDEEAGAELMQEFLSKIGVKKGDVLLEEGSGLSRRDVITPDATVALLSHMSRSRWADVYRNALPVAGVDGTLQNRMKGTEAAGNVRAKTGTLRYVYTLAGYVTTASGGGLGFFLMLNKY